VGLDPAISEWGNPARYTRAIPGADNAPGRTTLGTETSKYQEEKKERSIP
jgi:hypothetical protein